MARSKDAIRLLPLATNVRASLAIDGPASASWNTIIQAAEAYKGPVGNDISLAAVADGTWVPNIGTLTLVGNAVEDETVTIGSTVYRWRDTLALAYDVKVGASASDSIDNLIAAINANGVAGTHYFAGTLVHPTCRAFVGAGDTMVVHTKSETTLAAVGTLIATTETMTQGSWGAATLADGTDGTNVTFAVTDEAIVCHFAGGYSTVSDFEAALAADADASALVEVLTAGTTPLYRLVVTDDDFSATNLSGGGDAAESVPAAEAISAGIGRLFYADEAMALVTSEAGSGTMTATITIWGYSVVTGDWYVAKRLNGGSAIAEAGTDRIAYSELLTGLGKFTKFAAELTVAGTGTEVEVWLDFVRPGAHD